MCSNTRFPFEDQLERTFHMSGPVNQIFSPHLFSHIKLCLHYLSIKKAIKFN